MKITKTIPVTIECKGEKCYGCLFHNDGGNCCMLYNKTINKKFIERKGYLVYYRCEECISEFGMKKTNSAAKHQPTNA